MIRPANAKDRDAICALHLASWQDSYQAELSEAYLRDELPREMAAKWAARRFEDPEITLVEETGGEIVGFVCALTDRQPPLIDNLHVRPDQRQQGTGAQLLRVVRNVLWVEGYDRAYLTVLESNPRALAFYLANGGRDAGGLEEMLVGHPVKVRRIDFTLG